MILGLGSDVVNISRIEKIWQRFGERFLQRTFTPEEILGAEKYTDAERKAAYFARRFAAKEACAKALGTGFRHGMKFKEIGVVSGQDGRPELALTGNAALRLQQLGAAPKLHVTLSDDDPVAMAVVVISGEGNV